MKHKILWVAVAMLMILSLVAACNPVDVPDPPVVEEERDGSLQVESDSPSPVTLVGSKWSSGNLVFIKKSDRSTMMTLDGTNGDVEITTATITNLTDANSAAGSATMAASGSTVVVTHGMSSTPTIILLSFKSGVLGTATSSTGYNDVYWSTANGTAFTINGVVASNQSTTIDWLAFITSP
jgi:hypothetical protein|tara:strand:+ start:3085 stop:3627 length:543 start_codon:yes stop_codon:yes gene_type:complete